MGPGKKRKETDRQFAAFSAYLHLGAERSLPKLRKVLPGVALSVMSNWRREFHWDARIRRGDIGRDDGRRRRTAVNYLMVHAFLEGPLPTGDLADELKMDFLAAYWFSGGNVAYAARRAGVAYGDVERWQKEDGVFSESMMMVGEALCDYVESALMRKIQEGNLMAIVFFLKNKRPNVWNERRFEKPLNIRVSDQKIVVMNEGVGGDADKKRMESVARILREIGELEDGDDGVDEGSEVTDVVADVEAADDGICSA